MKRNIFTVVSGFLTVLFLFAFVQVKPVFAQTNVELKRQIEEKRERVKLLEELRMLEEKEKALTNQQPLPAPTSTTTPTPIPTPISRDETLNPISDNNTGDNANVNPSTILPAIQRVRNLFDPNDTGTYTVCQLQDLEKTNYNRFDKNICDLAKKLIQNTKDAGDTKILFEPSIIQDELGIFILGRLAGLPQSEVEIDKNISDFVLEIENKRTDKQVGADSKGSGTTSLATKGGIPRFLSWALENGSISGAKDGTTLTFRANPVGFAEVLSGYQPFKEGNLDSYFKLDEGFTRELRKLSVGFSFDITRGTDSPVFIGNKQQLSAINFRYNFINQKDPLNPMYKDDWEKFRKDFLDPYANFANELYIKLTCENCSPAKFRNTDLEKWRVETQAKLQTFDVTNDKDEVELVEIVRSILASQIDKLPIDKLKTDPVIVEAVKEVGNQRLKYFTAKKALLDKIAKGAIMTIEYTNYREVNAPDLSNIRFVAEKGLIGGWNFTANASFSFFNKKPSGMNVNRIRDFDFTLNLEKTLTLFGDQTETNLSNFIRIGNPIFSFSGQYQRLQSDVVGLDGIVKPDTKGDIAVGQFKLIIPINNLGIKLPISVSFANRSELIKESTVRAHFGFTFNLDRLLLGRLFQ